MTGNSRMSGSKVLVTALFVNLLLIVSYMRRPAFPLTREDSRVGITNSMEHERPQPGDYTITIGSTGTPVIALLRTSSGRPVIGQPGENLGKVFAHRDFQPAAAFHD